MQLARRRWWRDVTGALYQRALAVSYRTPPLSLSPSLSRPLHPSLAVPLAFPLSCSLALPRANTSNVAALLARVHALRVSLWSTGQIGDLQRVSFYYTHLQSSGQSKSP